MNLYILGVFIVISVHIHKVISAKKDQVEWMYYQRNLVFDDLPLSDDTYIGKYPYHIPSNNDVIGIEYHALSGVMINVVVRLRPGVPSTLNAFCVSDYPKGSSPHVWGFPNYDMNTLKASYYGEAEDTGRHLDEGNAKYSAGYYNYFFGGLRRGLVSNTLKKHVKGSHSYMDNFSLVSSHHPIVDNRCNRLFTLDSGTLRYSASEVYEVQPASIVVFDLPANGCETRQFPVVKKVEIPTYLYNNPVGYNFMTLDHQSKGTCDDVFIYASNAFDNRVLVYDYRRNTFWNVEHSSMKPVMSESYMVFSKDYDYQLPLGVVSVALGWPDKEGNKLAYFTPGSSQAQYVVSTKHFKNQKRYSYKHSFGDYVTLLGYRGCNSQAYKQIFDDSTGVLFSAEMQSNRLTCWNTQQPLSPDTVGVVYQSEALEFVSGLLIDPQGYLWFQSSQVPIDYLTNIPLDISDVNSRTFRVKVSDAVKGTVCENTGYLRSSYSSDE